MCAFRAHVVMVQALYRGPAIHASLRLVTSRGVVGKPIVGGLSQRVLDSLRQRHGLALRHGGHERALSQRALRVVEIPVADPLVIRWQESADAREQFIGHAPQPSCPAWLIRCRMSSRKACHTPSGATNISYFVADEHALGREFPSVPVTPLEDSELREIAERNSKRKFVSRLAMEP